MPPFLLGRILARALPAALLRNCAREIRTMRGTQDAGGHACERVHCRPLARPNGARAFAGDVTERAPERAEALPAGLKRDVGHRKVGIAQQGGRPLDAPSEEIAMRRNAERLLERSCEVRCRHAAHASESRHGPFLVRGGIHAVLRAQQAAQEVRIWNRIARTHVAHCTQRVALRLCQSFWPGVAREWRDAAVAFCSRRSRATLGPLHGRRRARTCATRFVTTDRRGRRPHRATPSILW